MTVSINFSRAAKETYLAIANDLLLNEGKNVTLLFLKFLDSVVTKKTAKTILHYRVAPHHNFAFPRDKDALIAALKRVEKTYPKEYNNFLHGKEISSENKALGYFINALSYGCCNGVVNTLFEKIHRKESNSLKGSVSLLRYEDIFYYQILHKICPIPVKAKVIIDMKTRMVLNSKKIAEVQQCLVARSLPSITDAQWELEKETIRKELQLSFDHIGQELHTNTFIDSEKFSIDASTNSYRMFLEKTMEKFPQEQDFVGIAHTPQHVIAFQYGPQGYFLYDSFDVEEGLFEYPDAEVFFRELRNRIFEDTMYVKERICSEKTPSVDEKKARENAEQLFKKVQPYFSIRPLHQINTNYTKEN